MSTMMILVDGAPVPANQPSRDVIGKAEAAEANGQVSLHHVGADIIAADVRNGRGRLYRVTYAGEVWACPCPATLVCWHLVAVIIAAGRPQPSRGRRAGSAVSQSGQLA